MAWTVHKFGGTGLADAARFANAASLVREDPSARKAVVVSAMAGVTDLLIEALERAARRDPDHLRPLLAARDRNLDAAAALVPGEAGARLAERIRASAADVEDVLRGVRLTRSYADPTFDLVSGTGELWSSGILTALLAARGTETACLDAREVLVVSHGETGPRVRWEETRERFSAWLAERSPPVLVVTGYVASDPDGIPTTLKRNGSDLSASIFASLLGAEAITIWTDVDGVLSADPRRVREAVVLPSLSYSEAMELAYFGAAVLHPHTMAPAVAAGIPIRIRNALRPRAEGTWIRDAETAGAPTLRDAVKGFSTVDAVALVNVEGAGMIGVPGVANRLFGALREIGVSVILISQASSEHSICFAVPEGDAPRTRERVEREFFTELREGQIQTVSVTPACSIVAAVGDRMVETPGVAARFFGALGKAGINVRAVAQGSSERNLSAVVDLADASRALRAVHAGFYLSDQTLSVGLVGPGAIGSELLRQIHAQAEALRARRIDLRVRGIAGSSRMLLDPDGIDLGNWREELETRGTAVDLEVFTEHVRSGPLPHTAIVDCTASEDVAGRTLGWLRRGIHVVTPNKKANASRHDLYLALRKLGERMNVHYLYEATVGAGLPVISTLRDLLQTGDRVMKIEGVLSGTLSYLFNSFTGERPFSAIVREAHERGYTEPDPRDDLSGMDVARKAVILAREMGAVLELSEVPVESLVPQALAAGGDADAFLDALPRHDGAMEKLRSDAVGENRVLRYTARIDADGGASVGLSTFDRGHPFSRLRGSDNIIAFTTERYREQPLLVQGPGAGPAVTAGGVFADLLRLASYLGAPS